jgi:hypothetical protein
MVAIGNMAWFALMNPKTRTARLRGRLRRPFLRGSVLRTLLAGEPGRSSRKDVALHAELLVLATQPRQLVTLGRRQGVTFLFPAALLPVSLDNPAADRLGGRFELAGQVSRITSGTDQVNNLSPELRRVRWVCLGHEKHLSRKPVRLHEAGQHHIDTCRVINSKHVPRYLAEFEYRFNITVAGSVLDVSAGQRLGVLVARATMR